MIFLESDKLEIRFPELHEKAGVEITFQRTLRIPDNDRSYALPPGLGRFPLRHIADYDLGDDEHLKRRGGLIMPMFQTDALWINFTSSSHYWGIEYPIAIKIGTGKHCVLSGEKWSDSLESLPQNYLVVPDQPWIDGYNVGENRVRQFVAAPLGMGYAVEEQLTEAEPVGGIQIEAFPLKREVFEYLQKKEEELSDQNYDFISCCAKPAAESQMGLGAGGQMEQEIYEDQYGKACWDLENTERCFVTLSNAEQWMDITGEEPPMPVLSAEVYNEAGLPWFAYYDNDKSAIQGAKKLGKIKSIKTLDNDKDQKIWGSDPDITPSKIVGLGKRSVSSGDW